MSEFYIPESIEIVSDEVARQDKLNMDMAIYAAQERVFYGQLCSDNDLMNKARAELADAFDMRVRFTEKTFLTFKQSILLSDPHMAYELGIASLKDVEDILENENLVL